MYYNDIFDHGMTELRISEYRSWYDPVTPRRRSKMILIRNEQYHLHNPNSKL